MKMMYFESIYTGQIYEVSFIPMGTGWKLSTKEAYEAQQKQRGF
jgi:hypothetical protein